MRVLEAQMIGKKKPRSEGQGLVLRSALFFAGGVPRLARGPLPYAGKQG